MIDFSTPLAGIQRAGESLDRSASRLATFATPQGDSIDLSVEVVAMLAAKTAVEANTNMLRTEADLSRSLVDLLG